MNFYSMWFFGFIMLIVTLYSSCRKITEIIRHYMRYHYQFIHTKFDISYRLVMKCPFGFFHVDHTKNIYFSLRAKCEVCTTVGQIAAAPFTEPRVPDTVNLIILLYTSWTSTLVNDIVSRVNVLGETCRGLNLNNSENWKRVVFLGFGNHLMGFLFRCTCRYTY